MPHKRAKRSVREKHRTESSLNIPPEARHAIDKEDVPKGAARILNAAKIQQEFMQRKRKVMSGDTPDPKGEPSTKKRRGNKTEGSNMEEKAELKIQPGESMSHFNRRVEGAMRGAVRSAMNNSSTHARKSRKEETSGESGMTLTSAPSRKQRSEAIQAETVASAQSKTTLQDRKPKEFEHMSTSAPRRLNDVVQAPPELKKLPRGAKGKTSVLGEKVEGVTLKQGALSMARKAMLEEERLRAVNMYRELKKAKAGG